MFSLDLMKLLLLHLFEVFRGGIISIPHTQPRTVEVSDNCDEANWTQAQTNCLLYMYLDRDWVNKTTPMQVSANAGDRQLFNWTPFAFHIARSHIACFRAAKFVNPNNSRAIYSELLTVTCGMRMKRILNYANRLFGRKSDGNCQRVGNTMCTTF